MTIDEKYMRRCIQLARNGICHAAPNPMVGAVIARDGLDSKTSRDILILLEKINAVRGRTCRSECHRLSQR